MAEVKVYGPRDYPHDGPILDAWGGHYKHAFIALHPFKHRGGAHAPNTITWSEVAREVGSPEFPDFALSVCLAANGMDGRDRPDADRPLIKRLMKFVEEHDLIYPVDATFPLEWCPIVHNLFRRLHTKEAIAKDYITIGEVEVIVPLDELKASNIPRDTRAMIDPSNRLIVTSFPMDTYDSIVGLTHDASEAVGGKVPLEGFSAGPKTTSSWVNERGTYSYPGWLA